MTRGESVDDMFGVKLIWTTHLFPEIPYFDRDLGEGLPALMNFNHSPAGHALADRIPVGHRCLVYVTEVQRFVWAIEFTGTIEDGTAAARRHGIGPREHHPFTIYRPIRFIARADPWDKAGATRRSVCEKSGPATPAGTSSSRPLPLL